MEKYNCEVCNFSCIYPAHWKEHLETKKHKNNGKRTRSDKILNPQCELCSFKTNNLSNMKSHKLTKHGTPNDREKNFTYYCKNCDFGTFAKLLYERHCQTPKHIKMYL
jgi:ribosomal protein L35